ncbi:MAG: hypothetical protein E6Q97_11285 [Desulfurellales bacterium]|nr:MAG: hypothetical protein E6Q97_11285 [Desulfurellales bacterium]
MKEELLKLAERVEALSGPDREVDSEIDRLTFRGPFEDRLCGCMGNCLPGHPAYDGACVSVPHYTASLDAAMTLKPEGWRVQHLGHCLGGWRCRVETNGPPSHSIVVGFPKKEPTATPALALCSAALRALAKGDV